MTTPAAYLLFPDLPGVYFFKNRAGDIIYIGKAKSLKHRIRSYFQDAGKDWKVSSLVDEHATVEYIVTTSEIEAGLLEADLIKEHRPKFNVLLRDGQPFLYIVFTKESLPKIKITRNKKGKGTFFGPFLHKQHARKAFNFLVQTFRLNICNKKIEHGCLDFHIGTCPGICKPQFNPQEYIFRLHLAQDVLAGNQKDFMQRLESKMAEYSKQLAFEKAQHLRSYKENFETIFSTLKSDYYTDKFAPDLSIVKTPLTINSDSSPAVIAQELATFLGSKTPIVTIDCFDISHFQSRSIVGSCVRFTNGLPDKNKFRKFNIKTLIRQDDYAALQEIVQRRYKNGDLPDLILIDGGKGQLNAVKSIMPHVSCVSLAKREETLFTEKHPEGILLDVKTNVGKLLLALRDYAHHFAITHHRSRRKKAALG
jgi:excinuclease ABC subunit C